MLAVGYCLYIMAYVGDAIFGAGSELCPSLVLTCLSPLAVNASDGCSYFVAFFKFINYLLCHLFLQYPGLLIFYSIILILRGQRYSCVLFSIYRLHVWQGQPR
jgi:hypothetical protein